ncbi:MAG: hypothetical protein HY277_06400, partial [Ignavibacteriales bacterium]|nr:hypothetical protein [Ignavibacteriales bacterium]
MNTTIRKKTDLTQRARILLQIPLLVFFFHSLLPQSKFSYDIVIDDSQIRIDPGLKGEKLSRLTDSRYKISFSADDDLVVDRSNNIFLTHSKNNRIEKFNEVGDWVDEIILPDERYFGQDVISPAVSLKLGLDGQDNLYVNVLFFEYEVALYKYDRSGKLLMKFPFRKQKPVEGSDRVINFFVSSRGNVYIRTFPAGLMRASDTPVYAYDQRGNFLGMVDYDLEDSNGDIYRFDRTRPDISSFQKMQHDAGGNLTPSHDLKKLATVAFSEVVGWLKKKYGNTWTVVGFDRNDNLSLTNGIITKTLDDHLREIRSIQTPLEMLEQQNISVTQRNIRISPNGGLYLSGMKRSD